MQISILAAGISAAALIPSFALAQQSCEQRRSQQAVGTIAGAGIGALLGSAIAGKRVTAPLAPWSAAWAAASWATSISSRGADCAHAYGYYDNAGALARQYASASRTRAATMTARASWVDGAPNGHYDSSGRWTVASSDTRPPATTDSRGRWVPASANGYYAADNRWVAGAASGYYDNRGRWIAGPGHRQL